MNYTTEVFGKNMVEYGFPSLLCIERLDLDLDLNFVFRARVPFKYMADSILFSEPKTRFLLPARGREIKSGAFCPRHFFEFRPPKIVNSPFANFGPKL